MTSCGMCEFGGFEFINVITSEHVHSCLNQDIGQGVSTRSFGGTDSTQFSGAEQARPDSDYGSDVKEWKWSTDSSVNGSLQTV